MAGTAGRLEGYVDGTTGAGGVGTAGADDETPAVLVGAWTWPDIGQREALVMI